MKNFIVELKMTNATDGYYLVVVEGETHLNRTEIKSSLQFFTRQGGYNYNHPESRAKETAEAIALGLNKQEQLNLLKDKYCIISLKRTSGDFLCFWRANDAGYTEILEDIGFYNKFDVQNKPDYYNNGESTLALPITEVVDLFGTTKRIPKNSKVLKDLKEKLIKNE